MFKLLCAICIGLAAVSAVCQSAGKYQVGTITSVKPHQAASNTPSEDVSYDVCVKVAYGLRTLVHAAARHENGSVRWGARHSCAGGKQTITYNDFLANPMRYPS